MTGDPRPQVTPLPTIRPARPEDAPALSALARRAKTHWGYDAAILAAYRDALTITPADIAAHTVRVATLDSDACGFYQLRVVGEAAELTDLWIDPRAIGRGHGRELWAHAVAAAGARGCRALLIQSDPHAAGFYRAMGATRAAPGPPPSSPASNSPSSASPSHSPRATRHSRSASKVRRGARMRAGVRASPVVRKRLGVGAVGPRSRLKASPRSPPPRTGALQTPGTSARAAGLAAWDRDWNTHEGQ